MRRLLLTQNQTVDDAVDGLVRLYARDSRGAIKRRVGCKTPTPAAARRERVEGAKLPGCLQLHSGERFHQRTSTREKILERLGVRLPERIGERLGIRKRFPVLRLYAREKPRPSLRKRLHRQANAANRLHDSMRRQDGGERVFPYPLDDCPAKADPAVLNPRSC
jgi:hypothetical protein